MTDSAQSIVRALAEADPAKAVVYSYGMTQTLCRYCGESDWETELATQHVTGCIWQRARNYLQVQQLSAPS